MSDLLRTGAKDRGRIHVIGTGGTIASLRDGETGGVRSTISAADLLAAIPGKDSLGPLATVEEICCVNGWNVTPSIMLEVASRVEAALKSDDVQGVVVTHGTDTVEETCFLCDLTVHSNKPVVFTAAMRSADELSADGPRNLQSAVTVVRNSETNGLGSVLVMNDEIHAARWVRKQDSFRVSAFNSPIHGPLGFAAPSMGVRVINRPAQRVLLDRPDTFDAVVPIVQTYTGMEEEVIQAVLGTTGAGGLVLEGTGLGNVPGTALKGIKSAIERGLPVVVATSVLSGGTASVYGGPGGGVSLRDMGVAGAGFLSAAKARLLLMVLLARGLHRDEVLERFTEMVRLLA